MREKFDTCLSEISLTIFLLLKSHFNSLLLSLIKYYKKLLDGCQQDNVFNLQRIQSTDMEESFQQLIGESKPTTGRKEAWEREDKVMRGIFSLYNMNMKG